RGGGAVGRPGNGHAAANRRELRQGAAPPAPLLVHRPLAQRLDVSIAQPDRPAGVSVVSAAQEIERVREVERAGTGPPAMPPDERREGEAAHEGGAPRGGDQGPAVTTKDRQ